MKGGVSIRENLPLRDEEDAEHKWRVLEVEDACDIETLLVDRAMAFFFFFSFFVFPFKIATQPPSSFILGFL